MGKLAEFSIILDKPQGIFHAGQRIEGNVLINLNDEMKIKGKFSHCKYTQCSGDHPA